MDRMTAWLRRSQLRLLAAIQATGAGAVIFQWVDWTPEQLAAAVLIANTWLAVAAGQAVTALPSAPVRPALDPGAPVADRLTDVRSAVAASEPEPWSDTPVGPV